ncbi:MAG TPA: hypothetical protein VJ044_11850, partial [Candidatus Hodarchaeales archaeon]|nr:hypothetical protein [Candidatus Hodarchaeales archaeon]
NKICRETLGLVRLLIADEKVAKKVIDHVNVACKTSEHKRGNKAQISIDAYRKILSSMIEYIALKELEKEEKEQPNEIKAEIQENGRFKVIEGGNNQSPEADGI